MDPPEQRSAFEGSPSYDTHVVSAFNADPGRDAVQYERQGDIEESQNQRQAACLSKTVSRVYASPKDNAMDHREQSTLFGHSDGRSTNPLVLQQMSDVPLDSRHRQHSVFSQCSGDLGSVKQLEPTNVHGAILDSDQQPAVLCNRGLSGDSIGDQEGLSRDMLNPDEPRGSALDELGSHDQLKIQHWEDQRSTEQSSTDSPIHYSTGRLIEEEYPDSNKNMVPRALTDVDPWAFGCGSTFSVIFT
ncbi:hypothetical protein MRX96_011718 [Rhipicephalus microplus]